MDKELKAKWVKKLRSGEYQQGQNYLFFDGKFCCLGVLGDVCGVPRDLMYELGVGPVADLIDSDTRGVLIGMNDVDFKTFEEIAQWIETNL